MKGNMFLGYAAGSVGDVTFARSKGQQVARARNRKPNNPKTRRQMTQRSLFMCPVKFFSRGRSALFDFAFESKTAQESDYNAFMRLNAKNGIMLRKSDYANGSFPAIGSYIMSQGSLPNITQSFSTSNNAYGATTSAVATDETVETLTIGQFSQRLIESGEWMSGDILTLVSIRSGSVFSDFDPTNPIVVQGSVTWNIDQIIVDVADSRLVSSVLTDLSVSISTRGTKNIGFHSEQLGENDIAGFCAIHSRRTDGGLKVSTTELCNSSGVLSAFNVCDEDAYKDAVLADWKANEDAILDGLIAYRGRR